jgi:hypothetical protein
VLVWVKRLAIGASLAAVALLALGFVAQLAVGRPLPAGEEGPEAEALAGRLADALGADAWARTGAIEFTVGDHRYLWDRERNLVRYEDDRGVVLTEGWRPLGRAFRDGVEFGGSAKDRRVRAAHAWFVNDSFWAFAPFKAYDAGARRALVETESGPALLVSYPTGGVTPGDAYLWEIGPDGVPTAWRIWASVLPVFKGVRAEWTDWTLLSTGARVADVRRLGPIDIRLQDVRAAATLAELVPGEDPFAPLFR